MHFHYLVSDLKKDTFLNYTIINSLTEKFEDKIHL